MLSPRIWLSLRHNLLAGEDLVGQIGVQRDSEVAIVSTADPERPNVDLRLYVDTPPAGIGKTSSGRALSSGDTDRIRKSSRKGATLVNRQISVAGGSPRRHRHELGRVSLESAVLDELRVDSPIARVIDILEQILGQG